MLSFDVRITTLKVIRADFHDYWEPIYWETDDKSKVGDLLTLPRFFFDNQFGIERSYPSNA